MIESEGTLLLLGTSEIKNNELYIGGVSVSDLKEKFGTPLYIIDQADLEDRMETFVTQFKSDQFETHISYASKAFTNLYMAGLCKKHGLHIDVVSGGELFVALEAGMDPAHIYFHGNNKTADEIEYALSAGVGTFVIDNIQELRWLNQLTKEMEKQTQALLRINPGIEASTHKYIQTTTNDSKFGISTDDEKIHDMIQSLIDAPQIDFRGFHCHVGSQVTDEKYFFQEAEAIVSFTSTISKRYDIDIKEINLGGGFGVQHTPESPSIDFESFLTRYIDVIEATLQKYKIKPEVISIEPGRSMINNSGYTLYSVGHVKHTLEGLPLIFVDGGMSDNPRPSLYEAEYHAYLANKMENQVSENYRVAGKLCESGDVLIQSIELPAAESGDLLIIPASGAYTYSMSSNYNLMPRPGVVFVKEGQVVEAVKRQSYQDLIVNQRHYSN
ncbi:MAG: diaminopimelate decarboxylase [Atopococcus tabaci]|uniref:Diaminopimelate decarboxylase n=1 Tax=Atopococcus tabaci TaxID=269774 RepID=A0AA43UCB7_9LACT|nr:diaminopimelate decarboxylase [Atopococcus tabaci]